MSLPASFIEHIIDLTCTIQAIPAPTFKESARADFFYQRLHALGLHQVQRDSVGNVLARLPGQGSARPLVVSAHMDTVHPMETKLTTRQASDRIIGAGIGDNALGLAAVIGLVELLQQEAIAAHAGKENNIPSLLPGDLWVAINVGEEGLGDLRGMQAVVDRFGASPLAYLVVEGMGLGTILHRGLGVERYKISTQTSGGHSWVDYGEPSAIHELCEIVSRISHLPLPRKPCTTLNVGIIHGGTSVNTIASNAWLELDLRSEDSQTLVNLVHEVRAIAHSAQHNKVTVKIERIGKRQAGQIPPKHPLVQLAGSVLMELGIEPRLDIASTDANLPLSRGYPAICIGITNGDNAHTQEEFILTGPVGKGVEQLKLLAQRAWENL